MEGMEFLVQVKATCFGYLEKRFFVAPSKSLIRMAFLSKRTEELRSPDIVVLKSLEADSDWGQG